MADASAGEEMGCKVSVPDITVRNLQEIITDPANGKYIMPSRPYDEVFGGIFLGGASTALNEAELQKLDITHVLNAAKGTKKFSQVDTDASYYKSGIVFHGIPATDVFMFKISKYFKEGADFIASSVGSKKSGPKNGRVYVHCKEGVSRSTTLVLAYLVTYQEMGITEALRTVRSKREVGPNPGFLQQLIDYSYTLERCY